MYSLFNDKGVKISLEWLRQLTIAIQCLFKETFWTKKGNFESLNRFLHLRSFYALRTSEFSLSSIHNTFSIKLAVWVWCNLIKIKFEVAILQDRRVVCKSVRRSWVRRSWNMYVLWFSVEHIKFWSLHNLSIY